MALSITSSEKNTPKSNLFRKKSIPAVQLQLHTGVKGFFQGEHDFGPEKMEENNKSHCTKWSLIYIYIHLYTKKNTTREPLSNQKKNHGWFVCYYSLVSSLIIISLWPGTALPDSRHLPGHDAPAPRRNWWTASWIENGHSLRTCKWQSTWFQLVHDGTKLYIYIIVLQKKRGAISTKIRE